MKTIRLAGAVLFFIAMPLSSGWAMGSSPREKPQTHAAPDPEGFTLTLRQSFDLALKRSETVAIKLLELDKSVGDFLEAAGEVIGDVDFRFTNTLQDSPDVSSSVEGSSSVGGSFNARTRSEGKLVFTQPVFQGFKEFGAIGGAGSTRETRVEEKRRAEEELFLEVAASFYEILEAEKDVTIIDGIFKLYEERFEMLKSRESIGRSRQSELATAVSRIKILEGTRAEARGRLEIARAIFLYYTGVPAARNRLEDSQSSVPDKHEPIDPSPLAEERSDVRAARHAMQTAHSNILVVQSALFPMAELTYNLYTSREGFQSDIDWDLLFTVDAPVFTGGTNFGRLKKAALDYRISGLDYAFAKKQATLEILREYENLKTAVARSKALEEAVQASDENFRLQKEEYERNLVSNLNVLEALEELLDVRRDANTAHYTMKIQGVRYAIAKGDFAKLLTTTPSS